MTNSSDKTKKSSGPVRWGAVVPSSILSALVLAYFSFFFDGHLRRGLEFAGTMINGAEVNVGHLSTHFLGASLEIHDVQVTDKNQPDRNILQVGKIHFKMLWDALLRAKVVVDDASILNIQALTPRRKPGYVVPPSPPSKGPSALEKVEAQVLEQTRKKYSDNFLGDVAAVLSGTDYKDQLKSLQMNLKSDARIKALEAELKEKKAKWEQRLGQLPQAQEFKAYDSRIKALKFDLKNPSELAKNVQEADKIRHELESKFKDIDQTSKDLGHELNAFNQEFKDLEKLASDDLRDLQAHLKLPNIDAKEFSQQMFMAMIEKKLGSVAKYAEVARHYMPPKFNQTAAERKAKQEENILPRKRGQGHTYRFPKTTGYPLFWLKHAAISSELGQSEFSGKIRGELKDLTSDPASVGRPTVLVANGDFPKQGISGFDANITLDHTTEKSKDTMNVSIASMPVSNNVLSTSPEVYLSMTQANLSSRTAASLVDQTFTMSLKNTFNNIKYDLRAKNTTVQDLLQKSLGEIPSIDLNAEIEGSLSSFDIRINSNLGDQFAKAFQKQLQQRILEARSQLEKLINERIGTEKSKLKQEMDKVVGPLTKNLDNKKAEAEKAIQEAKAQIEKNQNQKAVKKIEEEGKKLLKKFGFGK